MNLPSLPLIDDWLFIDNSFIESITTCSRQAEYSRLHKRKLASERSALNFGSAWHAAMQARYTHQNYDFVDGDCTQAMVLAAQKHFAEHEQPEGEYRNLDMLVKMIAAYNDKYPTESFEILELEGKGKITEFAFAVPLPFDFYIGLNTVPIKVMYSGRIDLGIHEDNMFFTLDHKTTYMYGNSFWMDQQMTGQHVGYCWALDNLLNIETKGYIVNAACTRQPSKSRPLPDAEDFQRRKYFITKERKQEWLENLIATIETFLYNYAKGYMPTSPKWCVGKYGACQFFDICSLPQEQRLPVLQSALYEDDLWSPLEQNKQQKT